MTSLPPGLFDPLVLLAGIAIGAGLFLLVVALYGVRPRPSSPGRQAGRREFVRALSTRTAVGVIVGVVVLVVTGWPVMAVGAVLLALAWRGLSGGAAEERTAMRRLEALAAWTESLRDTIAGAAGLEQAIPSSIRAAAPTLRPHLRSMVDRLHTRMALPDALRRFADELDDPSADLVVAALILNSKLRGTQVAARLRSTYEPARLHEPRASRRTGRARRLHRSRTCGRPGGDTAARAAPARQQPHTGRPPEACSPDASRRPAAGRRGGRAGAPGRRRRRRALPGDDPRGHDVLPNGHAPRPRRRGPADQAGRRSRGRGWARRVTPICERVPGRCR